MSNLLKALAMPPFGYYAPWEQPVKGKEQESSTKTSSHAMVPEQPSQIKVHYLAPSVNQKEKAKDMTAYVVPDQATHVEYFIHFTHQQFVSNILGRLEESSRKKGDLLFELLPKCLQGAGVTIWSQILEELEVEKKTKDEDLWYACIQRYLEEVAGLKYLKDAAIRFLLNSKKPLEMTPHQYFRRRSTIVGYIESKLLRGNIAMPMQV